MKRVKARTITYHTPVTVKFTAKQMEEIHKENASHWEIPIEEAYLFCDEDLLMAASRLGLLELPQEYTVLEDI